MNRQRHATTILAVLLALAMTAVPAGAAEVTLSSNTDLDGGAALGSISQSGGDGSRGNPWVYQFTNGGGGLDLGAYTLLTDDAADSDSFLLNMGGQDIVGQSGVTAISTYPGAGSDYDPGFVYIINVGNISIGTIDTSSDAGQHYSRGNSDSGQVRIGLTNDLAGNIRVDNIYTHHRKVFAESSDAEDGYGNDVAIYSSGDVLIETSGGTAGVIQTYSYRQTAGDVYIYHDGSFRAERVDARSAGRQTASAEGRAITIDGDYVGDGASGTFEAVDLTNAYTRTAYGDPNYDITVSGYLSVLISGSVDGSHASAVSDGYGSDLAITGITGDITIGGTINLNAAYADSRDGTLTLETSGGTIYLAELDLDLVRWAHLDAGPATVYIEGELLGFDTGNPTSGDLDETGGGMIYYDPSVAGNAYLGGQTYELASGGSLAPVPEPATLALLGLGGLAMAGGTVRHRRR